MQRDVEKEYYWIDSFGGLNGPVQLSGLKELCQQTIISGDTEICAVGTKSWHPYRTISETADPISERSPVQNETKESAACPKPASLDRLNEEVRQHTTPKTPIYTDSPQKDTSKKKRFSLRNWAPNRQSHKGTSHHSPKECEMTHKQATIIITLLLIALGFPFFSVFKPAQTWEYKHITLVAGRNKRIGEGAFEYSSINLYESDLNKLGNTGWELVGSYLEMETAFPNFGKSDFVTGLQPNIRPQCLVLIFKRPRNLFSAFIDGYYYTGRTP